MDVTSQAIITGDIDVRAAGPIRVGNLADHGGDIKSLSDSVSLSTGENDDADHYAASLAFNYVNTESLQQSLTMRHSKAHR